MRAESFPTVGPKPVRLRLRLTAAAESIVRGGHPWVFADSVKEQNRAGVAGELAVIFDRNDKFLAIGFFDPESPIRVRVLHVGKPVTIDVAFWRARLDAAVRRRDGLFDEHTSGYRIINGESDGWPGLVLDRYDTTFVLKIYAAAWLERLEEICGLICQRLNPERIILRISRNLEHRSPTSRDGDVPFQKHVGSKTGAPVVFLENGVRFEADVWRGQKTGFFLDQRENRRLVESLAQGRTVLNAFSFSGGFSLYAARGGAKSVTDLDLSQHALESARRNFKLNENDPNIARGRHESVQADAFDWLAGNTARQFDLVVLDPPSLAKRETERAGAIRAYAKLVDSGLKHLRPGGILLACSCSAHVSAEEFFGATREAARKSGRRFTELRTTRHAPDHHATFPEAEYLKGIYLQLEFTPQANARLTASAISRTLAAPFNTTKRMKNRFPQFLPFCATTIASVLLMVALLPGCQPRTAITPAPAAASTNAKPPRESGFQSLFDGKSLAGWKLMDQKGDGYGVTNGVIYCAIGGGGNLMTEKEYGDFIFRFEFKLEDGSNNGVGIRTPLEGDAAYVGMEIQILEEGAAERGKWGKLKPEQYHGSIYGVIAAQKGALKPPGEWNTEEITAQGRHVKVVVNGTTIVDADLNDVNDPYKISKHPGIFRERGHIGFLGHNDYIEVRNIRIKELPPTGKEGATPVGFTSMFDGKDLKGWKGLVGDPKKRAAMSAPELANAQAKADELMRASWKIENGALAYRGTNYDNLCTAKDYVNFELLADWKIEPYSDSGLYLRGTPQVQIWDPYTQPTKNGSEVGSGGLYNNRTNGAKPLVVADKPIGEWNRFRIVMAGSVVHVFLNGELVVNGATLENYWQRDLPVFPFGPIELQAHKSVVWFKNLYIRELHQATK